jgi:hypothetical protein
VREVIFAVLFKGRLLMERKGEKGGCRIRMMGCKGVDGEIFKEALGGNGVVRMIEYFPCLEGEEKLIYDDVFFLEKMMRIIHLSNNSCDFVPVLGVNFVNYTKDALFLEKILTAKP